MQKQELSPLRSWSSRKPWPECPEVVIWRCADCGSLLQLLDYQLPPQPPCCCGQAMERLEPLGAESCSPDIVIDYKIVGGFDQNAVQLFWECRNSEEKPQWVLLKTFTGGYIKYVTPKKRPPLVFPLSDEDAYAYCDKRECERCMFRCKRGFILYVYFASVGLLEMPLDRIAEFFQAKP